MSEPSAIKMISSTEPTSPATDQNPSAIRYQITFDSISYWVDAVGDEPTPEEVGAALFPQQYGFYAPNQQTVTYVLALTDANDMVEMNCAGANDVEIPLHATVAFDIGARVIVVQLGAGLTSIVAPSGVTICKKVGSSTAGPTSVAMLGKFARVELYQTEIDVWVLSGDL